MRKIRIRLLLFIIKTGAQKKGGIATTLNNYGKLKLSVEGLVIQLNQFPCYLLTAYSEYINKRCLLLFGNSQLKILVTGINMTLVNSLHPLTKHIVNFKAAVTCIRRVYNKPHLVIEGVWISLYSHLVSFL